MFSEFFKYINCIHNIYMENYIDCYNRLEPFSFTMYFSNTSF